MIITFNLIGLGILMAAASIAVLFGALLLKLDPDAFLSWGKPACMVAYGIFMIVLDIWYRMTRGKRSQVFEGLENSHGPLMHPRCGGQFGFFPVWFWGGSLSREPYTRPSAASPTFPLANQIHTLRPQFLRNPHTRLPLPILRSHPIGR
jgi:hypothetical protein